jgi:hypothetical protein
MAIVENQRLCPRGTFGEHGLIRHSPSGVTTLIDIRGNQLFYIFADGKIYIGIGSHDLGAWGFERENRGDGLSVG